MKTCTCLIKSRGVSALIAVLVTAVTVLGGTAFAAAPTSASVLPVAYGVPNGHLGSNFVDGRIRPPGISSGAATEARGSSSTPTVCGGAGTHWHRQPFTSGPAGGVVSGTRPSTRGCISTGSEHTMGTGISHDCTFTCGTRWPVSAQTRWSSARTALLPGTTAASPIAPRCSATVCLVGTGTPAPTDLPGT